MDTGAEVTVLHGNPKRRWGLNATIWGLGDAPVQCVQTRIRLQIGDWKPNEHNVMIAATGEYIIEIDLLKGNSLVLGNVLWSFGAPCWFQVQTVVVGRIPDPAPIPVDQEVINLKQYKIPGGDLEIQQTIDELIEAGVIRHAHSPLNSPVWPVKKSDGTWRMMVDYRGVNKVTPPIMAAVPEVDSLIQQIQQHAG